MPTVASILAELKAKAAQNFRATYVRHGMPPDRTLGVSTANMKAIAKSLKKQQALALSIYDTGIFEAMYLAGMIADGAQMSRAHLQAWAEAAAGMPMIFEYTVPWVTVENADGPALAAKWVTSKKEHIAAAGWATYSGLVATVPDDKLDLRTLEALLKEIPAKIKSAPNRVRAAMNSFVIAVGTYVAPLQKQVLATAKALGTVEVDVGDTACEIPVAAERIAKAQMSGRAGVKRKTIRC